MMMQIVIDIPKEMYNDIKSGKDGYSNYVHTAVRKGTPLPKGHGDLKDMNDLCYKSRHGCKGNCDYLHVCNLYDAPTIIEADEESELNESK
jgi:hypothetical protein